MSMCPFVGASMRKRERRREGETLPTQYFGSGINTYQLFRPLVHGKEATNAVFGFCFLYEYLGICLRSVEALCLNSKLKVPGLQ